MDSTKTLREPFFTQDRGFYRTLFSMLSFVAMQNLIAYSVNMADNIMLGSYSQTALSGAAIVNQIFFIVQQLSLSIGNSLVVLSSQYWGKKETDPIRTLTGITVKFSFLCSIIIVLVCSFWPYQLLSLFTSDAAILAQGAEYLSLLKWTFALFMVSNILMAVMRSVRTVNISFYISIMSLIVNVCINYTLIYGNFGFPEMGIRGAAIGTLIARILEFTVVVSYVLIFDRKLRIKASDLLRKDSSLSRDYRKVALPLITSTMVWSLSVPMQTAILGHLSEDAIAANSVATTFYQYLKVIVMAMASTSSVIIGNTIGSGNISKVKAAARTLSVIFVCLGLILGGVLYLMRYPLLSLYNLSPTATALATDLIALMSLIMVGMSYQMPVISGIFQGGGDVRFTMKLNMISVWLIVMPLSFLSAFYWKLPVVLVVLAIQSDQLFKCVPAFFRLRSYKWIRKLTRS